MVDVVGAMRKHSLEEKQDLSLSLYVYFFLSFLFLYLLYGTSNRMTVRTDPDLEPCSVVSSCWDGQC